MTDAKKESPKGLSFFALFYAFFVHTMGKVISSCSSAVSWLLSSPSVSFHCMVPSLFSVYVTYPASSVSSPALSASYSFPSTALQ